MFPLHEPVSVNRVRADLKQLRNLVIRAGLRLLEEHEVKLKALQDALVAGERSGEPKEFDFEAFKARKRAEFRG